MGLMRNRTHVQMSHMLAVSVGQTTIAKRTNYHWFLSTIQSRIQTFFYCFSTR